MKEINPEIDWVTFKNTWKVRKKKNQPGKDLGGKGNCICKASRQKSHCMFRGWRRDGVASAQGWEAEWLEMRLGGEQTCCRWFQQFQPLNLELKCLEDNQISRPLYFPQLLPLHSELSNTYPQIMHVNNLEYFLALGVFLYNNIPLYWYICTYTCIRILIFSFNIA